MPSPRRPRLKSLERDPAYALLRELKAGLVTREYKARVGAFAVGIGRKEVNGKRTGTLALRHYVTRKQRLEGLGRLRVPSEIEFVSRRDAREHRLPTDVIEAPQDVFEQDPESRLRPVPGGCSFGISGSTGTLGGWVWDLTDDTIVALTNNHVLEDTVGVDTMQPGSADGGSLPADKIGDVKRTIARSTAVTNLVDCAISDVDDPDNADTTVIDIGDAVYASVPAALDMLVEKSGQTTGHTFGEIIDADYSTTVTGGFEFDDCIRVDRVDPSADWSAGGDSGSLVFRQEDESGFPPVVGLHMSGSGTAGTANKIQNVFDALDLTTICAGFFQAFLDALFETEEEEREVTPAGDQRAGAAGDRGPAAAGHAATAPPGRRDALSQRHLARPSGAPAADAARRDDHRLRRRQPGAADRAADQGRRPASVDDRHAAPARRGRHDHDRRPRPSAVVERHPRARAARRPGRREGRRQPDAQPQGSPRPLQPRGRQDAGADP